MGYKGGASEEVNICLDCGMCCDGTLVGQVTIREEEFAGLDGVLEFEKEGSNGCILTPCSKLCGGCTVYADRPQECRKFECDVLVKVNQGSLAGSDALMLIAEMKVELDRLKTAMKSLPVVLSSKAFFFKMKELAQKREWLESNYSLSPSQLGLFSEVQEFSKNLDSTFGVPVP